MEKYIKQQAKERAKLHQILSGATVKDDDINQNIKEMKRIGLTKISELSDAEVPNNIPVGDYREGTMRAEPKVGECFWLNSVTRKNDRELFEKDGHYFRTSPVIEVMDEHTFKTVNSVYKITEI